MKTLKKVEIIPIHVDHIPRIDDMEQGKVYVSKKFSTSSHLCLCGCGELTVTPLNTFREDHFGSGWDYIEDSNGKITLSPSIGNYQMSCKSHYILTKNIANFV